MERGEQHLNQLGPLDMCLQNELVVFNISGFLPGEYILRVFPLISKATQSRRFSLSLLGARTTIPEDRFMLQEPMYGIHSIQRDFKRIFTRGHVLNAFKVEDGGVFLLPHNSKEEGKQGSSDNKNNNTNTFPSIQQLHITKKSLSSFHPFSFDQFPRLTKLGIENADRVNAEELLSGLWKLSLTSLAVNHFKINRDHHPTTTTTATPPAFATSLRLLHTRKCEGLVDMLSPFCHSLQSLVSDYYHHEIVANNSNLTTLEVRDTKRGESLSSSSSSSPHVIDLSQHTQLTKLIVGGNGCLLTNSTHLSLSSIELTNPDPDSACQFLKQCPALTSLELTSSEWQHFVQICAVLKPENCTLNFHLEECSPAPSINEVVELWDQGFGLETGCLLDTRDASWGEVVKMVSDIQTKLSITGCFDSFLAPSPADVFTILNALNAVDLDSKILWTQEMISTVVKSCPLLKELKIVGDKFSGALDIELQSLCRLDIRFFSPFLGFNLQLPNLTHCSLCMVRGEGTFLQEFLDRGELIRMPLLRVLNISTGDGSDGEEANSSKEQPIRVCCQGHQSLTHLRVGGKLRQTQISAITLQNLPNLRSVKLSSLPIPVHVDLQVPGNCDVHLACWQQDAVYTRIGYSDPLAFSSVIGFDEIEGKWVENYDLRKRRKMD